MNNIIIMLIQDNIGRDPLAQCAEGDQVVNETGTMISGSAISNIETQLHKCAGCAIRGLATQVYTESMCVLKNKAVADGYKFLAGPDFVALTNIKVDLVRALMEWMKPTLENQSQTNTDLISQ